MNDAFNQIFNRIAKKTYVVVGKAQDGKLSLLTDPGMSKPWSSTNLRLAQFHASQNNGQAMTAEDAMKALLKSRPEFEDELYKRIDAKTSQFSHDLKALKNAKRHTPKS